MAKIRAGVIGAGIGKYHIEGYQAHGGAEVVALCDVNEKALAEVADDFGLGMEMKRSGGACEIVNAFSLMGLHWYRTLGEAARGAEKAWSTVSNFSVRRTIAVVLFTALLEWAPFLMLLPLLFVNQRIVSKFTRALLYGENI